MSLFHFARGSIAACGPPIRPCEPHFLRPGLAAPAASRSTGVSARFCNCATGFSHLSLRAPWALTAAFRRNKRLRRRSNLHGIMVANITNRPEGYWRACARKKCNQRFLYIAQNSEGATAKRLPTRSQAVAGRTLPVEQQPPKVTVSGSSLCCGSVHSTNSAKKIVDLCIITDDRAIACLKLLSLFK